MNYKATVGTTYHRFGAVCGKIAEYHASIDQFEASECVLQPPRIITLSACHLQLMQIFHSYFFDEAYNSYKVHSHYTPELARYYFIRSEIFERRGDSTLALEARRQAQSLYEDIVPQHQREPVLVLDVLNGLVAPWVW